MKTITSFSTMSEDIINNTFEYVTQLIKSKDLDFSTLKNPTDILHYFTEVTSCMKYPTDKFDPSTGERVMKCVGDLYGRKLNLEMLKAIYSNISNWYYTEYEDRFTVKPVYTKEIVDVIKELKKAAWMITSEDVPKFFNALVNTAKVMNGTDKTTENQKSYWLVSPVKGGGKTTLTDSIFDGFEKDGYICKKLGMPEKEWPDLRPFANCHFAVVNDISKAPDYDVFKALTRREVFDSRIRCVGLISTKPRAAIWGSSNYNAPFETDRGSVTINTVGLTVEDFGKTQFGQIILNNAKQADLSGISLFSRISLPFLPTPFGKNKIKNVNGVEKKYAKVREIKGVEVLINLIENYVQNTLGNAKDNLKKITLARLRKDSGITISDAQLSLVDRILESIRQTEGLVLRGKKNGDWKYTSWNLSELSDISTEILEGEEETITPEEEIIENQEAWDEIIALFENNTPTDPNPTIKHDDDFEKMANEILVENGEEPITKEEYEEAFKRFEKEIKMTDEEINEICKGTNENTDEALKSLDLFVNGEEIQQDKTIERNNEMVKNNTSYTDKYCTKPTNKDTDLFESINPIKQKPVDERMIEDIPEYYPRKDIYCESMRNFIFEMDDTLLEEQQALSLKNFNSKIVNRVVFSGSKSFHNRVTIDEEPESIEHYKFLWNKINENYFLGLADTACKNPSRLTRKPGAIRNDEKTGFKPVEQKLIVSNDTVFSIPAMWNNEWQQKKMTIKMLEMMRENRHYYHIPQSVDILTELESMENRTHNEENRQLAISLVENDGALTYDQAARAVVYIGTLGFSAEEIMKQVDFGKWNFRKDYIEKLLSH